MKQGPSGISPHAKLLQEAIHFVHKKNFCAFMGSIETATAVTPLAPCCSNQSRSPKTRVSTPLETPTPSCWGCRNSEYCVETSGITATEKSPIRDHRDTANEEPAPNPFLIVKIARSKPSPCPRAAPALVLAPGPLYLSLPALPLCLSCPLLCYCYSRPAGVGTPQPTPQIITCAPIT